MSRKQKIKNTRTKLDSMLDYLEIEQGGSRNEKMSKRELKRFIDKITVSQERQVVEDVVRKLKDKLQEDMDNELEDSVNEDFIDERDGEMFLNDQDITPDSEFDPEIEKVLAWLSAVLYSGDYKIQISSKDNKTQILLIKLNTNDRK